MTPKCPYCKHDQDDCSCSETIESLRQQLASQGEALAAALAACKGKDDELEQLRSPLNMYKLCGD